MSNGRQKLPLLRSLRKARMTCLHQCEKHPTNVPIFQTRVLCDGKPGARLRTEYILAEMCKPHGTVVTTVDMPRGRKSVVSAVTMGPEILVGL